MHHCEELDWGSLLQPNTYVQPCARYGLSERYEQWRRGENVRRLPLSIPVEFAHYLRAGRSFAAPRLQQLFGGIVWNDLLSFLLA